MLRPTFMGFDIAKRGIQASQKGLDIVGQNMTNWDSKGYTRQRVDLTAISPSVYTQRYSSNRIGVAGQGVDITGIAQIRDSFLDKRFRDENCELGYFEQASQLLSDIEGAISEYVAEGDSGLRFNLQSLLKSLAQFTESPYSEAHANIIATEVKNITQTLHHLSSKLDDVEAQQKYNLGIATDNVNQIFSEIAELNDIISKDTALSIGSSYYKPNELYDKRNLLLDELSKYGEISQTEHADGSITLKFGGMVAVDGKKYETLTSEVRGNGTVAVRWSSTGTEADMRSGSLRALSDFINGRGPNVISTGETALKGVRYYRDQLDVFASTFAGILNSTVPETGGVGFKELLGGMSATPDASGKYPVSKNTPITAANISVSDKWTLDSAYVIPEPSLKDNNYIHMLQTALSSVSVSFNGNGESFTGTFSEYILRYTAVLAEDTSYYGSRATSSAEISNELDDRRDSVSGVVMDEEVTGMMMYNKSLQAASRLMTVLDEALDVLINRTGLVGR